MGLKDRSATTNVVNGGLRLCQIILSVVIVGVYACWLNKYSGTDDFIGFINKLKLGIAAGSLSIITSLAFGIVPFLVSYYYVAIAFVWEWILFFIWTAVFAWWHHLIPSQREVNYWKSQEDVDKKAIQQLYDIHWVVLVVMLLFLISALMGPICLLMDRKNLLASRAHA